MLKKVLALLLALMLVLSLCACGEKKNEKSFNKGNFDNDDISNAEDEGEDPTAELLEEMSIVSNDDVTVRITGIDPDGLFGYTLQLYLENKTDKKLMFSIDNASVNDVMCDPFWAAEISTGQKAHKEVSFSAEDLLARDIKEVTKIEFTLIAYDNDDWMADHILDQQVTVYPLGEQAVKEYVRTPKAGEIAVFDTDDCTMIITGIDADNFWGYSVEVYMYNKTDKNLTFAVDNSAVNGFDCDALWATDVVAGKHAVSSIAWFEEDFEDNGITAVEKIWLELRVSDADDWMADDLLTEEIEFAPF